RFHIGVNNLARVVFDPKRGLMERKRLRSHRAEERLACPPPPPCARFVPQSTPERYNASQSCPLETAVLMRFAVARCSPLRVWEDFESEGRRFDPCQAHQFKLCVADSITRRLRPLQHRGRGRHRAGTRGCPGRSKAISERQPWTVI